MRLSMRKLFILILVFVSASVLFSRHNEDNRAIINYKNIPDNFLKQSIGETDSPSPVMLSWIGTGKLGVYTISNTGQNGYFEPPINWTNYTGEWPSGYTSGNGRTGEFPRGSQQFYVWAAGLWVGAQVQQVVGSDTVYVPRVATAAYYSDQGALSDLYQSNQLIPSAADEGAGDFLFKQKGVDDVMPYQRLWTYADTSINERRRALGYDELLIDPESGDYMSDEDTYTVWGDYFPQSEASTIFLMGYDTEPVGVRVEQRTYSWSTDAFIYLNYRITNMNDFPLRDVYFGYFMDNDIGDATDDLIGYDENLNLGYSYDSDLQESGWKTLAGYCGTVFVKTPQDSTGNELGLTGFQTWTIDGDESDVDSEGNDDLKYEQLQKGGFEIFSEPQDVRQLTASGPVTELQPGETVEVTIAVVAGGSLAELRRNTEAAYERYELGYIGPEPPPSPRLTLEPGDKRVIVNWDDFPEQIADPFSGKVDFEGYRVYRSEDDGLTWGQEASDLDRYPRGWVPIAEYDIPGNETGRFVSVAYTSGTSSASIKFEDFTANVDDYYNESEYTIEFLPQNQLLVYNLAQFKSYRYNRNALNDGEGFAILRRSDQTAYTDNAYRSNAFITFDGILISIKNDTTFNEAGDPVISAPGVGDVFKVQTFESQGIGDQAGLDYVYVDEELINGVSYTYAVTAFDAGDPTTDLPSLESSIFSNRQAVVPRGVAPDRTVEELSNVAQTDGIGNGSVSATIHNPLEVITADFEVEFFTSDTTSNQARFMRVINSTVDTVVVDSVRLVGGSAALNFYGIDFVASGLPNAIIDTSTMKWKEGLSSSYKFEIVSENMQPFDYEIEFTDPIDAETFSGDSVIFPVSLPSPWRVRNITLDKTSDSYAWLPLNIQGFVNGSIIRIMREGYGADLTKVAAGLVLDTSDSTDAIQPGDVWVVNTVKPFVVSDKYTFSTQALNEKLEEYSLDAIKVVPNPYYVRAQWDTDRFNKHIKFTHLPSQCRIRIFTTSGILIRTIEHSEDAGDPVGYHRWDLRNKENLDIASGLYIYQVEDLKTGKEKIGKFAIIL